MKRILKALLISLLIPGIALAEFPGLTNSSQATLYGSQQQSGPLSIDLKGNLYVRAIDPTSGLTQSVIPVSNATSLSGLGAAPVGYTRVGSDTAETSSTATVINATAHVARVGDIIQFTAGTAANVSVWSPVIAVGVNTITVSNAFPSAPANGDTFQIGRPLVLGASAGSSNSLPSLSINIDSNTQLATATGILKLEDTAHSSGDAGVQMLGVQNSGWFTLNADGDYSPIATGRAGQVYSTIVLDDTLGVSHTPVRAEDAAFSNGDPVVMTGAVNNRSLATFNTTSQDVTPLGVLDYGNLLVTPFGSASTNTSIQSNISAASNNSTNVKAAAGTVYSVSACNVNAAARYLKLYNKATAPTCGTDTPVLRVMIPPATCTSAISFPTGIFFGSGIGFCIVTGITDADNTSTAANEQIINIAFN